MLSPAALWCEGHTEWRLTGRVVNYADEMFRPVTHSHKFFPQPQSFLHTYSIFTLRSDWSTHSDAPTFLSSLWIVVPPSRELNPAELN